MGKIHKLDETIVQRIAAGEVIQRPCSAIKELLENSLDAEATNVNITLQEGGYKSFSIQDNGSGIMRGDLPLLCERYATSKLSTLEDLKTIGTFGFRGEALASISHVSRLTVTSKTEDAPLGYRLAYRDGKMIGEPEPIAANRGTLITVQDLFYNNPVRREVTPAQKNEEYLRAVEVVQKYAIERAGKCAFSCGKGTSGVQSKAAGLVTRLEQSSLDIIRAIYGDQVASALLSIECGDSEAFQLKGMISNAYHQQKSFTFVLFINGRLVESQRLRRAIGNAYAEILLKGNCPFVYLSLRLAPGRVDVNVHPTKREVIFLEEDLVIQEIVDKIKGLLSEAGVVKVFTPTSRPVTAGSELHASIACVTEVKSGGPSQSIGGGTISSRVNKYPFQQIHTNPQARSLDFFAYSKRAKLEGLEASSRGTDNSIMDPARGTTDGNPFTTRTLTPDPTLDSVVARQEHALIRPQALQLTSCVKQAKRYIYESLLREASLILGEIMRKHSFVGVLSARQIFLQFETSLVLMDMPRVMVEWLFNVLIDERETACSTTLSKPWSILECLECFLAKKPDFLNSKTPSMGDGETLAREIADFIARQSEFLRPCLGFEIKEGCGRRLFDPLNLFNSTDQQGSLMCGLGEFFFRLAIDLDWEELATPEKAPRKLVECVCRSYSEMLVTLFVNCISAPSPLIPDTLKSMYQHDILERLKKDSASSWLPVGLTKNGAVVKVATTHDLYKIFERC